MSNSKKKYFFFEQTATYTSLENNNTTAKMPSSLHSSDEEVADDDYEMTQDEKEMNDQNILSDDAWMERMYKDRDCSSNISKNLRVVPIEDVQICAGRDGYAYFFTSLAEGPMLSSMALQQILILLHVIHSFIPEECILDTDLLKVKQL